MGGGGGGGGGGGTATKTSRYSIILVDIISHVTYRNANKYLNVHQELKLVEANKVGPLYIFSVLRIVSVCEKKANSDW